MTTATLPALDVNTPQKVRYCCDLWLRDEQIKHALKRPDVGRLMPVDEPRAEPIAVVGFGPSLNETWEQIKTFQYVMTCSGSHKFLLERGIVPTWHVDVDPRPHKVALLGEPHPDVMYLPASTCHPSYFDKLKGYQAQLWHIFDQSEDGIRMLPPGEWAITGGCDAGLRALTLSAFLGFRDLHVFGLDGSAPLDGPRHAADHPNGKTGYCTVDVDGETFYTTPAMLEASRGTFHELNQLPKVTATFYGTGLTQALARTFTAKTDDRPVGASLANVVAFVRPTLISAEYRRLNEQLHADNMAYGVGGAKHAETVTKLVKSLIQSQIDAATRAGTAPDVSVPSVLDYGCGKSLLAKALTFPIAEYDPAVPGKQESPRPADLVVATDVLEHIERDLLLAVLHDLRRCVKQIGYFVIDTLPSMKVLADGRNTHLIQEGAQWWRLELQKFFKIATLKVRGRQVHVLVAPKDRPRRMSVKASVVR